SLQFSAGVAPYAVMTHPGSNPVIPSNAPDTFKQLTIEASHEMIEMITDPIAQPGQGWYTDTGKEIVDICVEQNLTKWGVFHGYTVSTYWSEKNQQCLIPPEDGQAKAARKVSIVRSGT